MLKYITCCPLLAAAKRVFSRASYLAVTQPECGALEQYPIARLREKQNWTDGGSCLEIGESDDSLGMEKGPEPVIRYSQPRILILAVTNNI